MMRIAVTHGMRYGRLVVIGEAPLHRQPSGQVKRRMICRCDCGSETVVALANLRTGHTLSCGCVQKASGRGNRTHGLTGAPIYRAWQDMLQRCYNPRRPRYATYGRRGIVVCQRWKDSFEAFLEDMGLPPTEEHSIDRIDNDGNYCKDNCRWATRKQQSQNTTRNVLLTYGGETMALVEWSRRLGINYATLRDRLVSGWPLTRAFTEPVRR